MELTTERYVEQLKRWPKEGRHILAHYDEKSVVVYQAFKPSIARHAVDHQKFGGKEYNLDRMTWIKPNFLWMMFRSGWASKQNQERILAIFLTINGFEEILKNAYSTHYEKVNNIPKGTVQVRLQWDPDHDPFGERVTRRAIQLGLRGNMFERFNEEFIIKIIDVTDFVHLQHEHIVKHTLDDLIIPKETIYRPRDGEALKRTEVDDVGT